MSEEMSAMHSYDIMATRHIGYLGSRCYLMLGIFKIFLLALLKYAILYGRCIVLQNARAYKPQLNVLCTTSSILCVGTCSVCLHLVCFTNMVSFRLTHNSLRDRMLCLLQEGNIPMHVRAVSYCVQPLIHP